MVVSVIAIFSLSAHADCLDDAAAFHRVNASLVKAIATEESGMNPTRIGRNSNGSIDIGLMQINSWWLPKLASFGVNKESLLDACTNAFVGTWILAQNIARYGDTWEAVGAYNAVSPSKRADYVKKIYRRYMLLNAVITQAER
jgi:soluble lytic murein transglycosylase-like protein